MRRQKRDMNNRAFQRGYQTGLAGKSQDKCPHETGDPRIEWMNGWREGRVDNWEGYTGVASVQNIAVS